MAGTQEVEQDYPFSSLQNSTHCGCQLSSATWEHCSQGPLYEWEGVGQLGWHPMEVNSRCPGKQAAFWYQTRGCFLSLDSEDTLPSPPFMFCFEYSLTLLVEACGILFLDQGLNLGPLHLSVKS